MLETTQRDKRNNCVTGTHRQRKHTPVCIIARSNRALHLGAAVVIIDGGIVFQNERRRAVVCGLKQHGKTDDIPYCQVVLVERQGHVGSIRNVSFGQLSDLNVAVAVITGITRIICEIQTIIAHSRCRTGVPDVGVTSGLEVTGGQILHHGLLQAIHKSVHRRRVGRRSYGSGSIHRDLFDGDSTGVRKICVLLVTEISETHLNVHNALQLNGNGISTIVHVLETIHRDKRNDCVAGAHRKSKLTLVNGVSRSNDSGLNLSAAVVVIDGRITFQAKCGRAVFRRLEHHNELDGISYSQVVLVERQG